MSSARLSPHCRSWRKLLAFTTSRPRCNSCGSSAGPRGRIHRCRVVAEDGRVHTIPTGGTQRGNALDVRKQRQVQGPGE
jgi:hypothetical protein